MRGHLRSESGLEIGYRDPGSGHSDDPGGVGIRFPPNGLGGHGGSLRDVNLSWELARELYDLLPLILPELPAD